MQADADHDAKAELSGPLTRGDIALGWGTVMQAGLPSLIEVAGAFGFAAISVAPARYAEAMLYGIDDAALRDQLGAAGVRVCATWHLSGAGEDVAAIERLPPDSIAAIQLADRRPGAALTARSLPGEGALPLHALVAAARCNDPDASVQVEIFDPRLRALGPSAAARRVAEALDAWLALQPAQA